MVSETLKEYWKRTGRSPEWIQNKIAELKSESSSTPSTTAPTKQKKQRETKYEVKKTIRLPKELDDKVTSYIDYIGNNAVDKNRIYYLKGKKSVKFSLIVRVALSEFLKDKEYYTKENGN